MSYIKPLQIGNLHTTHNLMLAPLAGISDFAFRQLAREFGADLTFTEMVSVDGLVYQNRATRNLLKIFPGEKPIGFQFFGSDPELFKKAIDEAQELGPDLIDLNFGCPVRKVVAKGAGAALLNQLDKIVEIVQTVKSVTNLPVTAKIRIGWDWDSIVAEDAARAVEAGGADAVTVHARTRSQGYSGKASWEFIARAKSAVRIPVIGNGDVFDGPAALEMFRTTGVDGIMLARGVLGSPWIFQEILEYLKTGNGWSPPNISQRLKIMEKHYRLELESFPGEVALTRMKKHIVWYTRGLPHTARLRNHIFQCNSFEEVKNIFANYLERFSELTV
jgi:tRNA-dihydrouridine synthase B